jgi:saccharopine dehydrogenase-like NADP-dependent oxidoreductase
VTRVVVVGAAGEMLSVTVESLSHLDDVELICVDRDRTRLDALVGRVAGHANVQAATVDLFDAAELGALVRPADLVVNGAGPFYRTALPVIGACVDAGVDYLDIGDDIEAVGAAIALDPAARAAGVNLLVGCGASPGVTNVLARELIDLVDVAETVHVGWCVGDEGPQVLGRAVLEHAVHMVSGTTPTWEERRAGSHAAWARSRTFDFGAPLGATSTFECPHPEVVTLPWHCPELREARCYGALRPAAANAMLRGVGRAVDNGTLSRDQAIDFLGEVLADGRGSLAGWRAGFRGLRAARRSGELTRGRLLTFLGNGLLNRHEPFVGGVACEVTGTKDGRRVTLSRSTRRSGAETSFPSMAAVTGTAAAAFAHLALDRRPSGGTHAPENWVEPAAFHKAMHARGVDADYLGPVTERPAA